MSPKVYEMYVRWFRWYQEQLNIKGMLKLLNYRKPKEKQ